MLDLREHPLPMCDGDAAYADAAVAPLAERIQAANGVILAGPVYNYGPSAAAKNLIELTGKAWNDQIVGLISAAGGHGSYQSPMSLAGMLMLDFRCLIVPRFVYATEAAFEGDGSLGRDLAQRTSALVDEVARIAAAVRG